MKLFVAVAEAGGIAQIANKQGVSSAAISKQIAILEKHLNVALFHRSNRRMNLTNIGEVYLQHCKNILSAVIEANNAILQVKTEPTGMLRIASGRYFAEHFIIPHLADFLQQYPQLMLDVVLSETVPNLKNEDIDIAFGSNKSLSADLVCRAVAVSQHVLCASPQYLKKFGIPKKPADLYKHRYITHSLRQRNNVLTFADKDQFILKPILRLNDAGSMLNAAIHGAGVISLNRYIVQEALAAGQLVELLEKYANSPRSIYLFYRKPRYIEPKIRAFIDFILSRAFLNA